jgi:hypothetical protein
MQDEKSSTEVELTKPEYEDELVDSFAKTMLESTPGKMSYFGPEDSI